jgi:hypothetical protein
MQTSKNGTFSHILQKYKLFSVNIYNLTFESHQVLKIEATYVNSVLESLKKKKENKITNNNTNAEVLRRKETLSQSIRI